MNIKQFLDNPISRRLSHDNRSSRIRRMLIVAGVLFLISLLLVFIQSWPVTIIYAAGFISVLVLPDTIGRVVRRLVKQDTQTEQFELLRVTGISSDRLIAGYGLTALYQQRFTLAVAAGFSPGVVAGGVWMYSQIWLLNHGGGVFSSGDMTITVPPIDQIAVGLIFALLALNAWTMIFPTATLNAWYRLARQQPEYHFGVKEMIEELPVSLGLWILFPAQIGIVALVLMRAGLLEPPSFGIFSFPVIIVLTMLRILAGIGIGLWMLRLAEKRLR